MFYFILLIFSFLAFVWFKWVRSSLLKSIDASNSWMGLSENALKRYKKLSTGEIDFLVIVNLVSNFLLLFAFLRFKCTFLISGYLTSLIYIISLIVAKIIEMFEPYIFSYERKSGHKDIGIDIWNYYAYNKKEKSKFAMFSVNTSQITKEEITKVRQELTKLPKNEISDIKSIFETKENQGYRELLLKKFLKWISGIIGGLFGTSAIVGYIKDIQWDNITQDTLVVFIISVILIGSVVIAVAYLIATWLDSFTKISRRKDVNKTLKRIFEELLKEE